MPDEENLESGLGRRGFLQRTIGFGLSAAAVSDPALAGDRRRILRAPATKQIESQIRVNQVGFLREEPKRAVVAASGPIPGNRFYIVDDDVVPEVRYRGELSEYTGGGQYGHFKHHYFANFQALDRPGRYRVRLPGGRLSPPFSVGSDVYTRLVPLMLKYFDIQGCGQEPSEVRSKCHRDDGVAVGGPRDGKPIDASGGWHDAGDYLKFVETTSYVTAVLLSSYDAFRIAFPEPERGAYPPVLRQARVGLDWLLKMHPSPEEFYYQVGDESDHDTWRLPEDDAPGRSAEWKPRSVYFGVGANLAGRTARAFALASRVYRPYDPGLAQRCLSKAQSVYRLGLNNRRVLTTKPDDYYPEKTWQDDMEWAAVALHQATGRKEYLEDALEFSRLAGVSLEQSSVYNVHALAHYGLYPYAPPEDQRRLLGALREGAEATRKQAQNPYGLGTPYIWGSAEAAAGAAITCLTYAALSGDKEYVAIARQQRDFILGCNPFGLCCVIGAGTRYPLYPHHQVANLRGIELSGAVVGGPADIKIFKKEHISLDGVEFSTQTAGPPTGEEISDEVAVYHDAVQDYVTNEPANDYTAKVLGLVALYIASTQRG